MLPGVEVSIQAIRTGFGNPIEIEVKGENLNQLYGIAEEIRAQGRKIPGIRDLTIEMEMGMNYELRRLDGDFLRLD